MIRGTHSRFATCPQARRCQDRENRTAIELFLAGIRGWEDRIRQATHIAKLCSDFLTATRVRDVEGPKQSGRRNAAVGLRFM